MLNKELVYYWCYILKKLPEDVYWPDLKEQRGLISTLIDQTPGWSQELKNLSIRDQIFLCLSIPKGVYHLDYNNQFIDNRRLINLLKDAYRSHISAHYTWNGPQKNANNVPSFTRELHSQLKERLGISDDALSKVRVGDFNALRDMELKMAQRPMEWEIGLFYELYHDSELTYEKELIAAIDELIQSVRPLPLEYHVSKFVEAIRSFNSELIKSSEVLSQQVSPESKANDNYVPLSLHQAQSMELAVAQNIIKKQRLEKRAGNLSEEQMKTLIDKHRFASSEKANLTAMGNELGLHKDTVKKRILDYDLSRYAKLK
ncbi:MAG: hypothetical protein ISR65_20700 [Bacteriovoracaceae bacterium]|nr:hypothetical protein [Bacteriovoracaceae bacterium]